MKVGLVAKTLDYDLGDVGSGRSSTTALLLDLGQVPWAEIFKVTS